MSEQSFTDEDAPQADATEIKSLRAAAAKGNRLERENAFLKAGINPDTSPALGYFVKGYDGELTPAAITQAAIDAGFIGAPAAAPDPDVAAAQAGQAAVQAASTGNTPQFDGRGAQYALENAHAEGGMNAVADVVKQFGYPVAQL